MITVLSLKSPAMRGVLKMQTFREFCILVPSLQNLFEDELPPNKRELGEFWQKGSW